ncbi:MAG: class I SAM-dependent methyltransferase [Rhodovulum sp.]
MNVSTMAKTGYVGFARGVGQVSARAGLLDWLDARRETSRLAHWARSLFAIHDLDGLIALDVPWWSYAAIAEVERTLAAKPGARVFEYGSGASTIWLARRAGSVTSVEHHAGWHARLAGRIAAIPGLAPVELRLVQADPAGLADPRYFSSKAGEAGQSFAAYARAIEADDSASYDLIVIDGRARAACLAHAIGRLAPGGLIVFDNSGRARYRAAIAKSGLRARCLRGLTPALPYPEETALLDNGGGVAMR